MEEITDESSKRLSLKDEFKKIDDYFDNISKEQLINDLIDCGLPQTVQVVPIFIKPKNPICIRDKIFSEWPMTKNIPMKTVQCVDAYDPRLVFSEDENAVEPDHVQIRRIKKTVPVDPQEMYTIHYYEVIEIIKEYTFEEWDNFESIKLN